MFRRMLSNRSLVAGLALVAAASGFSTLAGDSSRPEVDVSNVQRTDAGPSAVSSYGGAWYHGAPNNGRHVGIAPTPTGNGYWTVNRRGEVAAFGDAQNLGDVSGIPINRPIVGIASLPPGRGNGYWLVADDGGIFTFGDARFFGSAGAIPLNQPVVGMAATKSGNGYWLVASDGGIFTYGDAPFFGSTGSMVLNKPVVGMAPGARGGYWLVASDGGIFSFGEPFFGSAGSLPLQSPVVSMAPTVDGLGYWLGAADGGIFTYGTAQFYGSAVGFTPEPITAMTARPQGDGYWMLGTPPGPAVNLRVFGAPPPPAVGFGKRVIYCNSCQRVWLIDNDTGFDVWVDSYLVSGRPGWPAPGTYGIQRRLNPSYTENGVRLDYFVGFAWGTQTDVGFHAIPISPSGVPLQSESELGQFRSHGCVRQAPSDARIMWDFAQPGTQVVVLP